MTQRVLVALTMLLILAGSMPAQTAPTSPDPTSPAPPPPPAPVAPADCPAIATEPVNEECAGTNGWWAEGEYLFAWFSGDRLPVLVTTNPAGATGTPTTPLFGGDDVNVSERSGMHLAAGWWTPDRCYGIEGSFTVLESHSTIFAASSTGAVTLAEPYIDQTTGLPAAVLIASPGTAGSVDIREQSGNYYEGSVDLTQNILNCNGVRVDAMFGYRLYSYDESLENRTTTLPTTGLFAPGTTVTSEDDFRTSNFFNGVDFGCRLRWVWGRGSLDVQGNVAVGRVNRSVFIVGNTLATAPNGTSASFPGGIYSLSSNIGTYGSHDTTALPELHISYGWQPNCHWRLSAGYWILGLYNIARAADQIDQTINPALLPGPAEVAPAPGDHPAFSLIRSDMVIQGISIAAEFQY